MFGYDKTWQLENIFRTWIHHKSFGNIGAYFNEFLETGYNDLFEKINEIISHAESIKFHDNKMSRYMLKHYSKSEFIDYQEKLDEIHDEMTNKNGYNHFSHFLCWSYLAENVLTANNEKKKTAELIARNILILKH